MDGNLNLWTKEKKKNLINGYPDNISDNSPYTY